MASVYSGSYVTIAATASSSDDGGCFRNATNDLVGHTISIGKGTEATFDVRVRAQIQTHWLAVPNEMMSPDQCGDLGDDCPPLFNRAWCFQERLLSPRFLRFDDWEISWSCRYTETCSCGYLDQVVIPARNAQTYHHPFLLSKEETESVDPATLWQELLSQYGLLSLTYEKDKLPAIAALAERLWMNLRRDDQYIAGMWASSLVADMTWSTPTEKRPRAQEWRAPTWSWASCSGMIMYFSLPLREVAKVIDLHCVPVEGAPFASFQHGAYVVLSGSAVTGHLMGSVGYQRFVARDSQVTEDSWKRRPNWVSLDIPHDELRGATVTVLLLARQDWPKNDPHPARIGEYWVLLRQVEGRYALYERVGITFFEMLPGALAVQLPEKIMKII
jgi:hypothetical protein